MTNYTLLCQAMRTLCQAMRTLCQAIHTHIQVHTQTHTHTHTHTHTYTHLLSQSTYLYTVYGHKSMTRVYYANAECIIII